MLMQKGGLIHRVIYGTKYAITYLWIQNSHFFPLNNQLDYEVQKS